MEVEDRVGAGQFVEGGDAHPGLHHVPGLEEPREVVEDELGVAGGAEPDHGEPGGLGLGAHDGQVFPDQGVEEGGLADVGDAGEGDVAGLRHAES